MTHRIIPTLLFIFCLLCIVIGCQQKRQSNTSESINSIQPRSADTALIRKLLRKAQEYYGDNQKLRGIYDSALNESIKRNYNDGAVRAIFGITAQIFEQGLFDSCYHYYELAYKYAQHPDYEPELLATYYLNKGTFHYLQGNYVAADSHFYAGLREVEEKKIRSALVHFSLLYNLYFTKILIKDTTHAERYLMMAEALCRQEKDTGSLKRVLLAKAEFYSENQKQYAAEASIAESVKLTNGYTDIEQYLAGAVVKVNGREPATAIPLIKEGMRLAEQQRVDFYLVELKVQLSRVYLNIGKYQDAEELLEGALDEALKKNFNSIIPNIYSFLISAYEKQGMFQKALYIERQSKQLSDSLLNETKTKTISELEIKYKTASKDREINANRLKLAEQDKRLYRQTVYILVISAVILILLAVFYALQRIRKQEVKRLQAEQEITRLRWQMQGEEDERQRLARELHDGLGGLLSSALMHTRQLEDHATDLKDNVIYRQLEQLINEAADEVRKTSNNLMPDAVKSLGLPGAVAQYAFSLQKASGIIINTESYGDLNSMNRELQLAIYRIIQELLNNVVKHSSAKKAIVQTALNNGIIGITVEDDGCGFDKNIEHQGKGLKNLHHRVKQMGGQMMLETSQRGTSVFIQINNR